MALANPDALMAPVSLLQHFEKRSSRRFALVLPLELAALRTTFQGVSVNIGSGGLLARCEGHIAVGTRVIAKIDLLQSRGVQTTLLMRGVVVRCEPGLVAIRRATYAFTRSGEPKNRRSRGRSHRPTRPWNRCGHNEEYWPCGDLR